MSNIFAILVRLYLEGQNGWYQWFWMRHVSGDQHPQPRQLWPFYYLDNLRRSHCDFTGMMAGKSNYPKICAAWFQVGEWLHFVSRTHVYIYIWNITSYISLVLSTDVHPTFLQLPTVDPWPPLGELRKRRPKKGGTQGGTPGCCSFTEVDEKLILMMCGHVANIVHTICALAGRMLDHSTVVFFFFK